MVLCFGSVTKSVDMTGDVLAVDGQGLQSLEAFFCLSYDPASEEAGGGQEAGRELSQDSRTQLSRGISPTMGDGDVLSSKSWGKDGWETFGVPAFVFPSQSEAFLEMAAHLPAHGKK